MISMIYSSPQIEPLTKYQPFWPQIDLHTALEDKLPYWFMKRVDKNSITIYPNHRCSRVS